MPHHTLLTPFRAESLERPGLRLTLEQGSTLKGEKRAVRTKLTVP